MFPPETEDSRSRLAAAFDEARKSGAEMLSTAFPSLPARVFDSLACSGSAALRFLFEHRGSGTALAAWDFRAEPPASFARGISAFKKNLPSRRAVLALDGRRAETVPAPKIFVAGAFGKDALSRAEIPVWQISRGNGATRISAHVFLADAPSSALAAETLAREFDALRALAGTPPPRPPLPEIVPVSEPGGGDVYLAGVGRAVEAIRAGRFRKIVLARAKDFAFSPDEEFPSGTFVSLLRERFAESGCTIFFARANFPGEAPETALVGATPETLLRVSGGALATEALAGTLPRRCSAGAADDEASVRALLADEKERREHAFVVDFIAEKLRALGMTPRVPARPLTLRLPNVFHLRTPMEADVPAGLGAAEIADALHPTPAMCGVPADAAERFIEETEPFSRGRFSAPVGFFDASGDGSFAVAIRCAKIGRGEIRLYAGAGIVADSVPAAEFAETEAKISATASLLGR